MDLPLVKHLHWGNKLNTRQCNKFPGSKREVNCGLLVEVALHHFGVPQMLIVCCVTWDHYLQTSQLNPLVHFTKPHEQPLPGK